MATVKKVTKKKPSKVSASKPKASGKDAPKKTMKKVTKKTAPKKVSAAGAKRGRPYVMNKHGFAEGTILARISTELVSGVDSREALVTTIEKEFGAKSRNGADRMVTNSVSQVIRRMKDDGYALHAPLKMTAPKGK
jgi:hypothetical protein